MVGIETNIFTYSSVRVDFHPVGGWSIVCDHQFEATHGLHVVNLRHMLRTFWFRLALGSVGGLVGDRYDCLSRWDFV